MKLNAGRKKKKRKKNHAKTEQTLSGGGSGAVLSAGGAQHAACGGGGGRGAVVGVVVVGRRARQDGVAVGRRAAELEPPQVLGVNRLVTLQHFDGLVHREPLPLAACGGSRRAVKDAKGIVRVEGLNYTWWNSV